MKQYPFRYPDELDEKINDVRTLQTWGDSKNKAIQNCIIIAAASVKKLLWGHAKDDEYEKKNLVERELKITLKC